MIVGLGFEEVIRKVRIVMSRKDKLIKLIQTREESLIACTGQCYKDIERKNRVKRQADLRNVKVI